MQGCLVEGDFVSRFFVSYFGFRAGLNYLGDSEHNYPGSFSSPRSYILLFTVACGFGNSFSLTPGGAFGSLGWGSGGRGAPFGIMTFRYTDEPLRWVDIPVNSPKSKSVLCVCVSYYFPKTSHVEVAQLWVVCEVCACQRRSVCVCVCLCVCKYVCVRMVTIFSGV